MRNFLFIAILLFSTVVFGQNTTVGNNQTVSNCQNTPVIDSLIPLPSLNANETSDVIFTGGYFDASSNLFSSCFTTNSVQFINHDTLIVNLTTNSNEGLCDLLVDNECGLVVTPNRFEVKNFSCELANWTQYGGNNYTVSAGQITKITTAGWQNHGVYDNTIFISSPGEYIEFEINTQAIVIGTTYSNAPSGNWDTEDFSFYLPNGQTYTRTGNQWQTHGAWAAGATMRIEINTANLVEFYRDGVLLRTSTATVTGPLYPFASSGVNGANVTNYQICK